MTLSASPWEVYEFNNSQAGAVGNGPSLNTYATTYSASGLLGQCIDGFSRAVKESAGYTLADGEPLSVSFWVQVRAEDSYGSIQLNLSSTTQRGVELSFLFPTGAAGTYNISGYINSDDFSIDASGLDNGWHLFVVVLNTNGTWTIYRNGSSVGTGSGATGTVSNSVNEIGISSSDGDVGPRLEQLAIFKAALVTDDVTFLFNSGNGVAYASWEESEPPASGRSFVSKQCFLTA